MQEQKESLNITAKTVDEAIEQGLAKLGLTRQEVDIEVIKEGRRGVFGIGAENAQVRLVRRRLFSPEPLSVSSTTSKVVEPPKRFVSATTAEVNDPVKRQPVRNFDRNLIPSATKAEINAPVKPSNKKETSLSQEEITEFAIKYLDGLLKLMGIKATVIAHLDQDLAEEGESSPLVLDVTGNDLGILIGRRNETLRSLQYVVRLAVNKYTNSWYPILVDVESYRVRRRRSLQQLAKQMAERAISSRRRVVLEAMPPYERRIIHVVLRDNPNVTTKSIGSNDNRKVTIIPK